MDANGDGNVSCEEFVQYCKKVNNFFSLKFYN